MDCRAAGTDGVTGSWPRRAGSRIRDPSGVSATRSSCRQRSGAGGSGPSREHDRSRPNRGGRGIQSATGAGPGSGSNRRRPRGISLERNLTPGHLIENRTERENVGSGVGRLASSLSGDM